MTHATWTTSPAYGSIVLGPTQRIVLDAVLRLTDRGRRPELTLGRLATITERPVSSVHDALGRLRALGLIGVSARMGRTGGHRLWRVSMPSIRPLDVERHRRAVARILRRFAPTIYAGNGDPASDGSPGGRGPDPDVQSVGPTPADRSAQLDPFGVTPADWTPPSPDETFAEKMRRYGIGRWLEEER